MKKLCKQIFICIITFTIFSFPQSAYASNQIYESSDVIEYDLSSNERADYALKNKNGEIYYLSIEPLDTTHRINNGTHNITVTKSNYWKAGFIATISSNKFISISSPYVSTIRGSSKNVTLKKRSSTHAKLTFLYTYLQTSKNDGFNAKIENGTMKYYMI